jgi:hypothetical protein
MKQAVAVAVVRAVEKKEARKQRPDGVLTFHRSQFGSLSHTSNGIISSAFRGGSFCFDIWCLEDAQNCLVFSKLDSHFHQIAPKNLPHGSEAASIPRFKSARKGCKVFWINAGRNFEVSPAGDSQLSHQRFTSEGHGKD